MSSVTFIDEFFARRDAAVAAFGEAIEQLREQPANSRIRTSEITPDHEAEPVHWRDLDMLVCRCGWITLTEGFRAKWMEYRDHVTEARRREVTGHGDA